MDFGAIGNIIYNIFAKVKTSSGFTPISKTDKEVTFAKTLYKHIKFDGEYLSANFGEVPSHVKNALDMMVGAEKTPSGKKGGINTMR